MELKTDEHIKKLNTFGVDAKAKNFAEIRSIEDLKQAREHLRQQPQDFMVSEAALMYCLERIILASCCG